VAWYRCIYAPSHGGAHGSHHRTAGIAGRTRRRGGGMAARGARAAGATGAAHRRLMNVGNGEWSAYCVTRSPETRGRLLNLEINRRCFSTVLFDFILDVLPFVERAQSSALNCGDVDEHVPAARLRLNETVALGRIEPLPRAIVDLPTDDPRDIILAGGLAANAATELCTSRFQCRLAVPHILSAC